MSLLELHVSISVYILRNTYWAAGASLLCYAMEELGPFLYKPSIKKLNHSHVSETSQTKQSCL